MPLFPRDGRIRTDSSLTAPPNCVLDSISMSYWRKLFVIVLLMLSLPVQAFAAVSLKCESSHIRSEVAPMQHAEMDAPAHDHHMHELTMADGGDHDDHGHQHRGAPHAHSCGTCASCCTAS